MLWGYSSAGRALEWHSRGKGFDPPHLHQIIYHLLIQKIVSVDGFYFALKRLETSGFRDEQEPLVSFCGSLQERFLSKGESLTLPFLLCCPR